MGVPPRPFSSVVLKTPGTSDPAGHAGAIGTPGLPGFAAKHSSKLHASTHYTVDSTTKAGPASLGGGSRSEYSAGRRGPRGATGAAGPAGADGFSGSRGSTGLPGPTGQAGRQGATGAQGIPGTAAARGDTG
jgi:hypothetical protein